MAVSTTDSGTKPFKLGPDFADFDDLAVEYEPEGMSRGYEIRALRGTDSLFHLRKLWKTYMQETRSPESLIRALDYNFLDLRSRYQCVWVAKSLPMPHGEEATTGRFVGLFHGAIAARRDPSDGRVWLELPCVSQFVWESTESGERRMLRRLIQRARLSSKSPRLYVRVNRANWNLYTSFLNLGFVHEDPFTNKGLVTLIGTGLTEDQFRSMEEVDF
jgi:hypothetical protein